MTNLSMQSAPLLVVEDNDADFQIISMLLEEAGLSSPVIHYRTGEEALEYVMNESERSGIDRRLPAHVLLDLNLPGIGGLEVLGAVRGNEAFTLVPVTILTTSSHPRDINQCYRAGANSYLIKPVDFERFERMLRGFAAYWFEISERANPDGAYA